MQGLKTIALKESTYQRLDSLRGKRESFDQAVSKLLPQNTDVVESKNEEVSA